jgi:predicted nucleotidyltransferase
MNSYVQKILRENVSIQAFYISGSYAYGTEGKDSDKDYRGVMMPLESQIFGLERFEQQIIKEIDITIFEMRKFVHLASNCNPNILELLFIDRHNHRLKETDLWKEIKTQRYLFLSKRIYHTYGGYAASQSKRLTMLDKSSTENKQRLDLIERYGYDTKKAQHLVRLLRTAIEILIEGTIHVFRPDRLLLKDIKNGKYSLKEIIGMEKDLRNKLENAYLKSELPNKVDYNKINRILIDLMKGYYLNANKK